MTEELDYRLIKLVSGEDIVGEVVCIIGNILTIKNPVVLHQVRVPRGEMIYESYVLSPWAALSSEDIYDISCNQIIIATKIKDALKTNYIEFVENRRNNVPEYMEESEFGDDDDEDTSVEEYIEELMEQIINPSEEEHNDNPSRPNSNKRTYH